MTAVQPATTRGFLFADLRDYTRYVETHGDEAAAALLTTYRSLVRDVVDRLDGAEIRTEGDSFYVVFPSASSAIQGGLAILAAAAEATRSRPGTPIRVAVGVHAGETAETGEGPVGSAVNIAARVCAQAAAGELLVTDTVRSLTRTRLSVRFVPRGSPRLKGIAEPIALFAVVPVDDQAAVASESGGSARSPIAGRLSARLASSRWPLFGVAVAVVVLVIGGANLLLGTSSRPSSSPASVASSSAAPTPTRLTTLPALADVPFYRADTSRSSVYPGPGPIALPELAWEKPLGGVANMTPIVSDGKVIVGDLAGDLEALDGRTGEIVWQFKAGAGFQGAAAASGGLIFAADLGGTLHAMDSSTGAERWSFPLPNQMAQPIVVDGVLYVGSSDGHAYGLDPATGANRWEWDGPADTRLIVNAVTDGVAYIGGGGRLFAIRLVDKAEVWHPVQTTSTEQSTAVLSGGTIYLSSLPTATTPNSEVLAIDRMTGKVRWRFPSPSGQQVNPGPVRDGIVYVNTAGDGVYALRDRGGSDFDTVWHNPDVPASFLPSALAGDMLYVGVNEGPIVALSAGDGSELWRTPPTDTATSNPVVTGGTIFRVNGETGVLQAWAEPAVIALLPKPSAATSAAPAPSQPPDPYSVVNAFSLSRIGVQVPVAMAFGPDGLLYILHAKPDASDPLVTVVDPATGRPVPGLSWGRAGVGKGEFDLSETGNDNGPGGCISVATNGLVSVGDWNNSRVQVFKPTGAFVRAFPTAERPGDCKAGPGGSLYVLGENGTLFKYDRTGALVWQMQADPDHPSYPFQLHGIALRPDGKIVGFVDSTGQVVTIDPVDGRIIGRWGEQGNEPGQNGLSGEPSVDAAGDIHVFQYVPQELQVFDPTGRLLAGQYHVEGQPLTSRGNTPDTVIWGDVYWPAPVFDRQGYGWTFGPDGLTKMKVSLAPK